MENSNTTHTDLTPTDPRETAYYEGFLYAIEALSNEKQQAEVTFTPVNFGKLLEMVADYRKLHDRRIVCDIEKSQLMRRIEDLERMATFQPIGIPPVTCLNEIL